MNCEVVFFVVVTVYFFFFFERLDQTSQSFLNREIRVAKMLISVNKRFMNLYVEMKTDKRGKIKSCFACNCECDINICKVFWEPCRAR